MATLQDIIKRVLGAENVEKEMMTTLTAQGNADRGARMQLGFILACSKSKMARNDPMPSLATDIIRDFREKVARYGDGTYPLSDRQIAVIARHFGQIVK